jgi:translocation and assembly module TamB
MSESLSTVFAPPKSSRLRRLFLRHLPLSVAAGAVLLALIITGLLFWASSTGFEELVRKGLIKQLEQSTGGRIEIANFHWHLLDLEADAGGLVIHGLEAPGVAPYVQVERVRARLSIFGFLSPRLLLRDLQVYRPGFHLIVYPDGTTNQPHPRKPRKKGKSALDSLFDLKAGHVSVEQGVVAFENRATTFDFQNRVIPLDFDAHDVSLLLVYVPAGGPLSVERGESYRIEAGATDLNVSRGITPTVHGSMQATLDLMRNAIYLRSLRVTSRAHAAPDHTVEISGGLEDFIHPHWQASVRGELDMRLIEPITGYPATPEGIARLNLASVGEAGEFRADGNMHIDGGSYIDPNVKARGVQLDTHIHADPQHLLFTSVVARLQQGGQLEGTVVLEHWLLPNPGAAVIQPGGIGVARAAGDRKPVGPFRPAPPVIPVNGKVTAQLKGVALDTILDIVGQPPFQRLGLDARMTGPATATWTNGDDRTLVVAATLNVNPSGQSVAGEVPTNGLIDGTYTQRDGAVDLRKLDVHMSSSQLEARGHLGAYPLTSRTALAVDFHTSNLWEFDKVLRDLGLNRYGKTGTAALPATLAGQGDFHGSWTGSLVSPRLAGSVKATQLAIELLPIQPVQKDQPLKPQAIQPRFVGWDTVEASGSYSAERIAVEHGLLRRGKAEIALNGALVAVSGNAAPRKGPVYDANSALHLRLRASKVSVDDLLPITGQKLPFTGELGAQLQLDGPVHAPGGSGWVELDGGSVYGEPVSRIRAQGTMASQVIRVASLTVAASAGNLTATGNYDLNSRRFLLDARGTGIEVARIEWLRRQGLAVTGKLGFTVAGFGTPEDPRLEARASLNNLALGGEPLGGLDLVAHTANRTATYDATSRMETAEFTLHGQTALSGDYATQAKLDFSRFNIGALLKLAHAEGLSGESALAGTVTVAGPLARPEELRGEARLQELAVTVAGVHLKNEGGVHATLANSRISLDPLHVIGEDTDLRAQGSLAIKGQRQLDIAASGSINLKLAQTIDPDLTASGTSTFQVEAHGPLNNPELQGRIDFQNGSLSFEDVPNGLSQLHGTLIFNQNRLEVTSLTAMSGGGLLSVSGYLAYRHGIYADLSATGNGIRIRYPQGVSSLADASMHLQGPQNNLLLSGDVLITRFTVSPGFDIAALAAQANAVQTIAPLNAPSNHIRLDVHLVSSPQLNFQNAYAKLAGDVDLRLRGTVASPSLLGRVSITEGNAIIAGTRYELQRGDIYFTNPVRIEPSIDLNATAHVEDYDITLGMHGTLERPTVTYRSDPPLPEADVVALLALGRTESQQRLYTQQQEQSGANPTTDALLGGALNATVSSRVQKLFGTGSVKVDPNYLGALGNSTSRIIVEEQLGRNLTLTYATNVNTTGQQLLQAEVAINQHLSLLVARDESGVFSMVIKATRRFR